MTTSCPLCKKLDLRLLETVYSKDISKLYKDIFNINISSKLSAIRRIHFYQCKGCDLRFFSPGVVGTRDFYEALQKINWYYLDEKYEFDLAMEYVQQDFQVLEVGCGSGAFARQISSKNYTGLELNLKAIEMAKHNGFNVLNESIEYFSKQNSNKFDIVCAFQVLEHITDINSFIEACVDCLKEDGFLIISVPSADSFISLATNNILNSPPHHQSWWSDICLKNITQLFNIDLVKIHHEKLADIHKEWYVRTLVEQSFRNLLGLKSPLIDISAKSRILKKLSSLLGIFLIKGFNDPKMYPMGHSVVSIYQKNENINDQRK